MEEADPIGDAMKSISYKETSTRAMLARGNRSFANAREKFTFYKKDEGMLGELSRGMPAGVLKKIEVIRRYGIDWPELDVIDRSATHENQRRSQ